MLGVGLIMHQRYSFEATYGIAVLHGRLTALPGPFFAISILVFRDGPSAADALIFTGILLKSVSGARRLDLHRRRYEIGE